MNSICGSWAEQERPHHAVRFKEGHIKDLIPQGTVYGLKNNIVTNISGTIQRGNKTTYAGIS